MGKYSDLRVLAETGFIQEDQIEFQSIDEAIAALNHYIYVSYDESLNESYYSRNKIQPLQDAMDKCKKKVESNLDIWLRNTKENKELEKAIVDIFGFKKCSIFWADPSLDTTMTIPSSSIFNANGKKSITEGWSPKGYYDKDHVLYCAIELDQRLFTKAELTSEEMVAFVLHEIGHNFDFSGWVLCHQIWNIAEPLISNIKTCLKFNSQAKDIRSQIKENPRLSDSTREDINTQLDAINKNNWISTITYALKQGIIQILSATPIGKRILFECVNLATTITHILPGKAKNILLKIIHAVEDVATFVRAIFTPLDIVKYAASWVTNPLGNATVIGSKAVGSFFEFKGEQFADSFATSYGYGPEMISGLNKLKERHLETTWKPGTIMTVFYDLRNVYSNAMGMLLREHGCSIQRAVYEIRYLNKELQNTDLSAEEKKAINDEINRVMEVINTMTTYDDDTRYKLTTMFNGLVYDAIKNNTNWTKENYVR